MLAQYARLFLKSVAYRGPDTFLHWVSLYTSKGKLVHPKSTSSQVCYRENLKDQNLET